MPFRYCNLTSGQVVESDEILSHLEGLARWDRTEQAATPAVVAPSVPAPKPARAPRVKAAKPDTGE